MHLVGQDDLLTDMGRALQVGPGAEGYTRVLLGHRGSGKTTLLATIGDTARASGMMVVDVDASTPNLPERIITSLFESMDDYEQITDEWRRRAEHRMGPSRMTGVGVGPLSASWDKQRTPIRAADLRYSLLRVVEAAEATGSSLLFTLDEMHAGEREELRRVAADLQYVTKIQELPMAFVGSGLKELEFTLLQDKKATFFHRCQREHLHGVDAADAWGGLRRYLDDAGVAVDPDALRLMADTVTGTTFYHLQSLGDKAWRIAAAGGKIDALAAAEAVRQHRADIRRKILLPLWHDLAADDQEVLAVLARLGGNASGHDLADAAVSAGFSSSRAMRRTISRLSTLELVTEHDGRYMMSGLLSAEDVLTDQLAGAPDSVWHRLDRPARGAARPKAVCGHYMPVAKARCVLQEGHSGRHRSRI